MSQLFTGEGIASLAALTFLEVVLGVDNIIFLAVAVQRLKEPQRALGRRIGLLLAMALRVGMLFSLVWAANLEIKLFTAFGHSLTIKDLVLLGGGLFLIAKGTSEIHDDLEASKERHLPVSDKSVPKSANLAAVVVQIGLIDIVFSLDSVITAVGMTNQLPVMVTAVVLATLVMLFAARPVAEFIHQRPTMKMLALSFILLIGLALVADGLGFHIPRGYIYFAIAFSLFVEILNSASRRDRSHRPPAPP